MYTDFLFFVILTIVFFCCLKWRIRFFFFFFFCLQKEKKQKQRFFFFFFHLFSKRVFLFLFLFFITLLNYFHIYFFLRTHFLYFAISEKVCETQKKKSLNFLRTILEIAVKHFTLQNLKRFVGYQKYLKTELSKQNFTC